MTVPALEAALAALLDAPVVAVPMALCACGHADTGHRLDLQAQRCDHGGCACPAYQHGATVLRVCRWLVAP